MKDFIHFESVSEPSHKNRNFLPPDNRDMIIELFRPFSSRWLSSYSYTQELSDFLPRAHLLPYWPSRAFLHQPP